MDLHFYFSFGRSCLFNSRLAIHSQASLRYLVANFCRVASAHAVAVPIDWLFLINRFSWHAHNFWIHWQYSISELRGCCLVLGVWVGDHRWLHSVPTGIVNRVVYLGRRDCNIRALLTVELLWRPFFAFVILDQATKLLELQLVSTSV
jgi:hypothetical protein